MKRKIAENAVSLENYVENWRGKNQGKFFWRKKNNRTKKKILILNFEQKSRKICGKNLNKKKLQKMQQKKRKHITNKIPKNSQKEKSCPNFWRKNSDKSETIK